MTTAYEESKELYQEAIQKIAFGEQLQNFVKENPNLEGLQKLGRKISQEIKFLRKVVKNGTLKTEHLQCSNLTHFDAIIRTLKCETQVVTVNKVYMIEDRKITVDIVSNQGLKWTKVVARNPKSLSQIFMGKTGYGIKSIVDQGMDYVQCAQLYPCMFQIPKIEFTFANGIGANLADKLEHLGIAVRGDLLNNCDIDNAESDFSDDEQLSERTIQPITIDTELLTTKNISSINRVNVDVSAMLAYCSNVANGSAFLYDFDVPVLKQQAEWERINPVKPILDSFFQGKNLYCCETAKTSFLSIVETVGGPTEKIRCQELLNHITVLPDDSTLNDTSEEEHNEIFNSVQFTPDKELLLGGKIKQRSLRIFLFGDRIKAVTVTSNEGFVRAAKQQNISFVVFIHESRALTEQKELSKAIPLHNNLRLCQEFDQITYSHCRKNS